MQLGNADITLNSSVQQILSWGLILLGKDGAFHQHFRVNLKFVLMFYSVG